MATLAGSRDKHAATAAGCDGYLEVLDRSGRVIDRLRLAQLPIDVGRAYDNDLVLADPYVCPHHVRIDLDQAGQLVATDQDSVNGLFATGDKTPSRQVSLTGSAPIRIGHTRLRYRALNHRVEPTLPDHHTRKRLGRLEHPGLQLLTFAATAFIFWAAGLLDSVEHREATEPVFDIFVPLAFIVAWAGVWGFAGRVITHRVKFLAHCAVACVAVSAVILIDSAFDYVAFAFNLDTLRSLFSVIVGLVAAGLMLYSHLRFATLGTPWRLATVSATISIAIVGLAFLKNHIDATDFHVTPQYQATLKAPRFQIIGSDSSADFFASLETLRDEVSAQAQTSGDSL